ncbi:MAG: TIGR04283 family arsenosugar biosynthesis glycosyltransferase [Rhodobacteraceae bacterium]|nr:TIGR04283 family arsenosugar biosynthesis glycosyltransferase [Paracoccaceae bacterium]
MPAPLSVVIPTLNAAETLLGCLEALFEGLFDGLIQEVIVSDGGSDDATCAIATELGARTVSGSAGRGGQIARGCGAARAQWVLVLHADTRLQPGWAQAVAAHMTDAPDRAGYFWLRFDVAGIAPALVSRWANLRARVLGLPYGDQGLMLPRDLLVQVGGYPDLPLMEDVALARVLRGRLRPLGHIAVTSADRYVAEGWVRRGARNLWCLARYGLGADPETLARAYRRR